MKQPETRARGGREREREPAHFKWAGNKREGRESWPGPGSAAATLLLCPEWTLRNSSEQDRASHHLPHLLWAKDDQGLRGRASCTGSWGPCLYPGPTEQGAQIKQDALPPLSSPSRPLKLTQTWRTAGKQKRSFALNLKTWKAREGSTVFF